MTERNRAIAGSTIIILTTLVFSLLLAAFRHFYWPVIFCFAGAAFYTILKYRGTRNMVFSVFIVTLLHLLAFKVTEPRYFVEFFLYYAALGTAVLIYRQAVMPRMSGVRIGKFAVLAALIVVLYSAATIIVSLFFSSRSLSQSLIGIVTAQSLIGIAFGLGLEIGELLVGKLLPEPLER